MGQWKQVLAVSISPALFLMMRHGGRSVQAGSLTVQGHCFRASDLSGFLQNQTDFLTELLSLLHGHPKYVITLLFQSLVNKRVKAVVAVGVFLFVCLFCKLLRSTLIDLRKEFLGNTSQNC